MRPLRFRPERSSPPDLFLLQRHDQTGTGPYWLSDFAPRVKHSTSEK